MPMYSGYGGGIFSGIGRFFGGVAKSIGGAVQNVASTIGGTIGGAIGGVVKGAGITGIKTPFGSIGFAQQTTQPVSITPINVQAEVAPETSEWLKKMLPWIMAGAGILGLVFMMGKRK